ncbi:MAG: cell wall hydrolase [Candidatus Gastranaerophilales bacterium]|nr:cell wall hydrolase [Candidatus Gastranaerophilales bacterium]
MTGMKKLLIAFLGLLPAMFMTVQTGMAVQAGSKNSLNDLNGGVTAILDPGTKDTSEIINATAKALNLTLTPEETNVEEEETSNLVMANVQNALNVRMEPNENAEKVGMLYKDCGGTILERRDGWTKLQSGNIVGWASDDYLLFGEEAEALANDVGRMIATVNTEALRFRADADENAAVYTLIPKGEILEVINMENEGWIGVYFEDEDGYVSADYVTLDFQIDAGETMREIAIREEAEREAKRHVNYGQYTTDADSTRLLAALIQCEAGGEGYEGQLAVASVVMNRVRSGAYPNSIHGVIYASGQFTPAMNGKVNSVYESGRYSASCLQAAQDAIAGTSNVGDLTHFRRNDGRNGLVIGHHVFY